MDYIQNVIEEQIKNKKVFNAMLEKWREQKANLTEEEAENIFLRFDQIKNGLSPRKPQVMTFLFRFDGTDYPRFDPKFIRDITKYSYDQISFLLAEYSAGEEGLTLTNVEDDSDFGKLGSHLSEENIKKSKKMWYGNDYKVVDDNGLRVYYIPDQKTAIKFGYYLKYSNNEVGIERPQWCVTANARDSNLWSNYRNERTFYFVIDENKPVDHDFRLAAIQRDTSVHDGYKLTNRRNSGDNTKAWNEIVRIFPQLENHKDALPPVIYNAKDELNGDKKTNIIELISETPGRYVFKRQPKNIKRRYIASDRNLSKPESWASMDTELRTLYINKVDRNNFRSKFSTYSLIMEVRKNRNEFGSLDHRLRQIGLEGVGTLFDFIMSAEFRVSKSNIENPNIKIYRSRRTNKLGIFHVLNGTWYSKGGVTYEPDYEESKPKLYKNAENHNEKFFVITYSKLGHNEDRNFYCVIPIARSRTSGFFLSADAFNALKENIVENDFMGTLPKSPEADADIT